MATIIPLDFDYYYYYHHHHYHHHHHIMGFRLYLSFPVQSHFIPKSPSKLSSSSSSSPYKCWDNSLESKRERFPHISTKEIETSCNHPLKPCAYSTAMQTLETRYSEMEEAKMNAGKRFYTGLHTMIDDTRVLEASKASHLDLLMKNLYILEETFESSNVVTLERDILVHLGRLGALNLFYTCLTRTLDTSVEDTDAGIFFSSSEPYVKYGLMKRSIDERHTHDNVTRSNKKEERKTKRKRALEKVDDVAAHFFALKTARKGSSKRKKAGIARNEAEMSKGIKVVANLEKIKNTMEKGSGHKLTYSKWAEAAGVEKKVLRQQLHFGWSCRDELVRSTRSLVVYLARNYRGTGIAFEDLIQAGNLGVLQGAERYDHTRGYKFSTYVQYWIRKSMSTLVAKHSRGVHIPFTLSRTINKIQKARKSLSHYHIKYPDDNEIAKLTGLSLPRIRLARNCLRVVGSIDQKTSLFLSIKFLECTPDTSVQCPEETIFKQHIKNDLNNLLQSLDIRERQVLALRYGLGDHRCKSLEEIGRIFSVSKEWIRKIEKSALSKLRVEENQRNLSYYLDP